MQKSCCVVKHVMDVIVKGTSSYSERKKEEIMQHD